MGQLKFLYTHLVVVAINCMSFIPMAHLMLSRKNMTPPELQENTTISSPSTTKTPHRVETRVEERVVPVCKHLKSMKVIVLYMVIFWNVCYQYFWSSALAVELKKEPYNASPT